MQDLHEGGRKEDGRTGGRRKGGRKDGAKEGRSEEGRREGRKEGRRKDGRKKQGRKDPRKKAKEEGWKEGLGEGPPQVSEPPFPGAPARTPPHIEGTSPGIMCVVLLLKQTKHT